MSSGFAVTSPVPKCEGPGAPSMWLREELGTRATRQGPRWQAAEVERYLVERWPGRLNKELWAGCMIGVP